MDRAGSPREIWEFREGWLFARGDNPDAMSLEWDATGDWSKVRVPHDWAIEGPFHRDHDLQRTRIVEDGETKVSEQPGRTGGLPHVGVAWYRRWFDAPTEWNGKRIFIEFDGAMSHSTVYVNGEEVGGRPYGYISFGFDITDQVRLGQKNLLAVRLDNKPFASRWYPGAGLYRKVRLVVVHPIHVKKWGTYITTPEVSEKKATLNIRTEVKNATDRDQVVELVVSVLDASGEHVAELQAAERLAAEGEHQFELDGEICDPKLWDLDSPHLYTAVTSLSVDGELTDTCATRFGVRTISFDPEQGFRLNGRQVKFKGVCLHHDLGALGAAFNRRAAQRQLEIMQDMGCNAIRTSHNPPAPEVLDLCDEMGLLVIDEAFDEWRVAKVENGYSTLFDVWAERDLRDMIRRDRNHPSIVMWSIGNEIPDQLTPEGTETGRFLTDICHDEDPTRPVTMGFNRSDYAIKYGLVDVVDIVGWNYEHYRYEKHHKTNPEWIMYGSETESTLSSRGEYYLPVIDQRDELRPSLHCNAYEVSAVSWGCPPEYELAAQENLPQLLGQFTWTGFDYLGEPTPYKTEWPSRSSYFGHVDLCGFPKDRYYLYKSQWTDEPTLHLFPHWNWHGYEGEIVPVHCYTNFDAAELFLNGKSLGVRRKAKSPSDPGANEGLGWPFTRYRLMWNVPYEPGTLEVVGLNEANEPIMSTKMVTAGRPARIELVPDRRIIQADADDLCFVTVRITDAAGNLCPRADNRVAFKVHGPGEIVAVDNGDPTSLEPFHSDSRRAFNGLCLLIVRAKPGQTRSIGIEAFSEGLTSTQTRLQICQGRGTDASILI